MRISLAIRAIEYNEEHEDEKLYVKHSEDAFCL